MTDTAYQYQYREGDEERVLAAIVADPGISSACLAEELGIAPDAIKRLTAALRAQRRAAFRSLPDEDGDLIVGWYPVPYDPDSRSADCPEAPQEPKNEAAKPDKETRTKCQYCGAEKETNVKRAGHERFCKLNPNRELAPGERKKAKVGPTRSADAEIPDCDGDTCRIGPLPVREDLPLPRPAPGPRDIPNTCTPIDVRQVTIRTTERPEDEPTPLARICSLAVEMEALAARHGYVARVDIDAYHERPKMQIEVCPKGVSE